MTKALEVTILGQQYSLVSSDAEKERLLQAVAVVDKIMQQIHAGGKLRSREKIAVLAAVQIAFDASVNAVDGAQTAATQTAEESLAAAQLQEQLAALEAKIDAALNENGELF